MQAEDVVTFLGKRFSPQHEGAAESRYNARLQGARARHGLDKAGLKMCDKFGRLPRIETTVRDVSYSTHYRKVEKRHGTTVRRRASVKKTIYSLAALRGLLAAANGRYLEFLAAIEDRRGAGRRLRQLPRSVPQAARHYRGLHFFDEQDEPVLKLIVGGEFQLRGMTNGEARAQLAGRSSGQAESFVEALAGAGADLQDRAPLPLPFDGMRQAGNRVGVQAPRNRRAARAGADPRDRLRNSRQRCAEMVDIGTHGRGSDSGSRISCHV